MQTYRRRPGVVEVSRIDWSQCEIVTIAPPPKARCPECGCDANILVRSLRGGDGSVTRYALCRRCQEPFVIVVDPELD